MLGSKKLNEAKQEIQELVEDFSSLKQTVKDLKDQIKQQNKLLKQQQNIITDLTQSQQESVKQMNELLQTFSGHNSSISSEIHNFKANRLELSEGLSSQFKQQLVKSLSEMENTLKTDTAKVDSLSKDLSTLQSSLKEAKAAILRLTDLSKAVKDSDFTLKEHAKALDKGNNEKLRLLKRIDSLESMLAKMKRNRNRY